MLENEIKPMICNMNWHQQKNIIIVENILDYFSSQIPKYIYMKYDNIFTINNTFTGLRVIQRALFKGTYIVSMV